MSLDGLRMSLDGFSILLKKTYTITRNGFSLEGLQISKRIKDVTVETQTVIERT